MPHVVDAVVIGAGVVGLAISRALARRGREVVVLERNCRIGSVTSARNSEVVHAGIYYPQNSLKARSCVRGRDLLYEYCENNGVSFKRCGKLIVATSDSQVIKLQSIQEKASANGVHDLQILDRHEVSTLEPNVECYAALLSPSTGVVDSHAFMVAIQGDLEDAGGAVAFNAPFEGCRRLQNGQVRIKVGGDEPMELSCKLLVNSAGLVAPHVASLIEGMPTGKIPKAYFAKGNYYSLLGKSPFTRLVYPVPQQAGLGVHATVDLSGQVRFGPDVEWVSFDCPHLLLSEGRHYHVDPERADSFYSEVRKYWPALPDAALVPDYSGIRPKIVGPGEQSADFVVSGPADHGVPGVVNLLGIESPGLTASLAIAEHVEQLLGYEVCWDRK